MSLLNVIQNQQCINFLYSLLRITYRPKTRQYVSQQTSSCKLWQLVVLVLQEYNKLKPILRYINSNFCTEVARGLPIIPKEIHHDVTKMSQIINIIINQKETIFYPLIFLNNPLRGIHIQKINSLEMLELHKHPSTIFPLCIYREIRSNGDGLIPHFFSVIYDNSSYFLLSSYGADKITVGQTANEIIPSEFNKFCYFLETPLDQRDESYHSFMKTFFYTYFFKGGVRTYFKKEEESEEEKDGWVEPDEGADIELYTYTSAQHTFGIGYLVNYTEELKTYISQLALLGKRKRKINRTKNRKQKKSLSKRRK